MHDIRKVHVTTCLYVHVFHGLATAFNNGLKNNAI